MVKYPGTNYSGKLLPPLKRRDKWKKSDYWNTMSDERTKKQHPVGAVVIGRTSPCLR